MIKRKVVFFLVLLMPINVYAGTGRLSVACAPQVVNPGDTINCTLSATTDFNVSSMEIPFSLSSNLKATGFRLADNNMSGNDVSGGSLGIYTTNDISAGTFQIGTFTVKVDENATSGNASVSFENVKFSDGDFTNQSIIGATSTITVNVASNQKPIEEKNSNGSNNSNNNVSNENKVTNTKSDEEKTADFTDGVSDTTDSNGSLYLSDLRVAGYNIDFDKNTFEYTITIKNESSLTITPMLDDSNAKYEIIGNDNLTDGSVISIIVSNSDSKLVYRINIRKKVIENSRYTLVFMIISALLVAINVFRIVRKLLIKRKERNEVVL